MKDIILAFHGNHQHIFWASTTTRGDFVIISSGVRLMSWLRDMLLVDDGDRNSGEYSGQMLTETGDPQGVLLIDDTAFPEKGHHSLCVIINCGRTVLLRYCNETHSHS